MRQVRVWVLGQLCALVNTILYHSSLELSDKTIQESYTRALLGTALHFD